MKALLDTSFFVATESGRPLGEMPGVTETEVSVVTLAELTLGVLMANDSDRAKRVATLSAVESTWDPVPVDAEVARTFAHVVASLRSRRATRSDSRRTYRGDCHRGTAPDCDPGP